MALAIEQAKRGRPSPNPHVGAVIATSTGSIISTGYHQRAGENHAEVAAINAAAETRGHTLYVTMAPCNHHGRTPPCTEAILAAGFARVVIGAPDPKPHKEGAIERLRTAGVEVQLDVCRQECEALIADFAKHIKTGLPYVVLKAAVTLDGKMATRTGDSKWITGKRARVEAHRMRAQSDAVLVGIETALRDNPLLTVRHVEGVDPLRVVADTRLRFLPTLQLAREGTIVFCGRGAATEHVAHTGIEVVEIEKKGAHLDLRALLLELGRRDIVRLLVEGGPTLHGAFLDEGHADFASVFVAPKIVGDRKAPSLASGHGVAKIRDVWRITPVTTRILGDDVLVEGPLIQPEHALKSGE